MTFFGHVLIQKINSLVHRIILSDDNFQIYIFNASFALNSYFELRDFFLM